MVGKKLAREQPQWGASPRGRRHVRPHVQKAAGRDLLKGAVLIVVVIGLLMLLGSFA